MKRVRIKKRFDKELLKNIFLFLGGLLNLISTIIKYFK